MNKKYNTVGDKIRTAIGGLMFFLAIAFSIWMAALSITKDPEMTQATFMALMLARGVLTIVLVSAGVDFMYNITRFILKSVGGKSYNNQENSHSQGYRYVEALEDIRSSKSLIDKHGLVMELEETVDFINYERRADAYEDLIDRKIFDHTKFMQKKKNNKNKENVKENRQKLVEIKANKTIVAKLRVSISNYDRLKCIEYDEQLSELYNEPKYQVVYTKDIYNMKPVDRNFLDKVLHSRIWFGFMERVKPFLTPLIFAGLTAYYIFGFDWSAKDIAMLIAVGISTLMAMGTGVSVEIGTRFMRDLVRPNEENNYVFKKFKSRNKDLIKVLEDGNLSIEEFHKLQEAKMEALKKQLEPPVEEPKIKEKENEKNDETRDAGTISSGSTTRNDQSNT